MIRTHILPCKLPRQVCDGLNAASGAVYTKVCVTHWRVFRKKGVWLSMYGAARINDSIQKRTVLHCSSVDVAQQGFYKACTTARAVRRKGITVRFPHKRKRFRTTIWINSSVKFKDGVLVLSNGGGNKKIQIRIPLELKDVLSFREVRLVFDKRSKEYFWHIVVENGKQAKIAAGDNIVSVDLGEVHPAVVGDEYESTIITCRELRHENQGFNKRMASLSQAISRTTKYSRKWWKLVHARTKLKAKRKAVMRDMEHKISRAIVDVAVERKANLIVIGDVRNIANGIKLSKSSNQKIAGWNHGKIASFTKYKAEAEGIGFRLENEAYTTQTCPQCGKRHKPKGRNYVCPSCGFRCHRDVVGQVNILSVHKFKEPGKILPGITKHREPYSIRRTRRCRDTGHGKSRVACISLQEANSL